eukprot:s1108_g2.t1
MDLPNFLAQVLFEEDPALPEQAIPTVQTPTRTVAEGTIPTAETPTRTVVEASRPRAPEAAPAEEPPVPLQDLRQPRSPTAPEMEVPTDVPSPTSPADDEREVPTMPTAEPTLLPYEESVAAPTSPASPLAEDQALEGPPGQEDLRPWKRRKQRKDPGARGFGWSAPPVPGTPTEEAIERTPTEDALLVPPPARAGSAARSYPDVSRSVGSSSNLSTPKLPKSERDMQPVRLGERLAAGQGRMATASTSPTDQIKPTDDFKMRLERLETLQRAAITEASSQKEESLALASAVSELRVDLAELRREMAGASELPNLRSDVELKCAQQQASLSAVQAQCEQTRLQVSELRSDVTAVRERQDLQTSSLQSDFRRELDAMQLAHVQATHDLRLEASERAPAREAQASQVAQEQLQKMQEEHRTMQEEFALKLMELAGCVDEVARQMQEQKQDFLAESTLMKSRLEATPGDQSHVTRLENLEAQQREEQARLNTESAALKARLQALELRLAAAALEKISAQASSAHKAQESLEVRMARLEAVTSTSSAQAVRGAMGVHTRTKIHATFEPKTDMKESNFSDDGDIKQARRADSPICDYLSVEYCNAASMLAPTFVCVSFFLWPPYPGFFSWRHGLMTGAVLLHLPFSCAYHLLLATRSLRHSTDCTARRLDQTFIHVTCLATGCALSASEVFTAFCVMLNLYFIGRLWAPKDAGVSERMANIGLGSGAFFFAVGAILMYKRVGGWGHSLMHIFSAGLSYHFMILASLVPEEEVLN